MSNQTNLTDARNNLADICAQVVADREVMIITQPNGENVALIAADELASLLETTHLLRSPKNAVYLISDDRIDFLQARFHY
ncbi:type II toxin-antitoxin system prevent-host-death family antitoxin [Aphanizomenon flos-aquae NRERC-008]|uniref:Antitoxin n=1 Tax=Aphanizomenon flos-aquae FACHB-1249 TaxID=2692889 RepID=A0ABR8IVG7_APHFL|nr:MULTISPECIES: type II toxin-antitoxin system prevent-host-death family antitoxin [Aphanizomenonaceae]MDM3845615.1 type II toxin-antitoxin system prevent-host-death family antitoxin [Aphanizomenon gracile PMC638.10]MDM3853678.1 type II toxin-antitoxin system prevent-host-death family antitoxin [Aphanizomenon gracile PMC649.10]MDM3858822.1 type II toxin-antitoxin system prevent-host-death family antitoxin [Aphanizomenon gracile PMC644.10]MBD2390639.1 type II toxin-antitoxin system prevent-host